MKLLPAKENPIAPKLSLHERFNIAFSWVEDAIYVGLAFLLGAIAAALLVSEIFFFFEYLLGNNLSEHVVQLLDRILLIIIFVEVLYTVQVSFRQHILQPGPFLVVGLIAVTRRILVLTAELPEMIKKSDETFNHAMMELGLLTVLIVALVVCIHYIRPADPNSAAEETGGKKK